MYFLLLSHVLPSISNRWFYLYFLLFTNRRFYLYSNWGVQMFWNLKIRPYFRRNSENWWVQFRSLSKIEGRNCTPCTPLTEALYINILVSKLPPCVKIRIIPRFLLTKLKVYYRTYTTSCWYVGSAGGCYSMTLIS